MLPASAPTAILADDEPHMRAMLREQLEALWPALRVVGEAEDGVAALALIESVRPDIAFLDIRMPGVTGLQVARAMTAPTRLVFVTAFDAHAIEAFEVHALDYLLKPVDPVRLARLLARLRALMMPLPAATPEPDLARLAQALARLEAMPVTPPPAVRLQWLQVPMGGQVRVVHIDDVAFFESDLKYTRVVAGEVDGIIRLSLKQLAEQLDPACFVQTHRGTVVNRRQIHAVHRHGEIMELELKAMSVRLKVSQPNHHLFRAM
ncbi:LytTR family DNA-binding domain-containing protein [Massilia sp.]|uniref:LytR/AlgR family response regulator transcription factor n=1 Tax=Massilia sp. TaxID=1882437 RepID=UPI002FC8F0BF